MEIDCEDKPELENGMEIGKGQTQRKQTEK
jgi:hypothetical protein